MALTWSNVLDNTRSLMNDTAADQYTNTVLLPYMNMALMEIEEIFELNGLGTTKETSSKLDVPANTSVIAFSATTPVLPSDLVEIQNLWCSIDGQENWRLVDKKDTLTPYLPSTGQVITFFNVWAWLEEEIRLIPSSVALDIRLDYIKSLFPAVPIGSIGNSIVITNVASTLQFRTAALAAEFAAEDLPRANSLNANAMQKLETSLGIKVKGMQVMRVRRKPFRSGWKSRSLSV